MKTIFNMGVTCHPAQDCALDRFVLNIQRKWFVQIRNGVQILNLMTIGNHAQDFAELFNLRGIEGWLTETYVSVSLVLTGATYKHIFVIPE